MNIDEKLKKIITDSASQEIGISTINENTILTSDLGFDSVQIIGMIIELESQFQIEIDDEDLDIETITVYKSLYDMVNQKVNLQK